MLRGLAPGPAGRSGAAAPLRFAFPRRSPLALLTAAIGFEPADGGVRVCACACRVG